MRRGRGRGAFDASQILDFERESHTGEAQLEFRQGSNSRPNSVPASPTLRVSASLNPTSINFSCHSCNLFNETNSEEITP
jgi:hypothetical protein